MIAAGLETSYYLKRKISAIYVAYTDKPLLQNVTAISQRNENDDDYSLEKATHGFDQKMRDYSLVPKLLANLSDGFTELNKAGLIKEEYFTSWDYQKDSECHARVLGAIIKAFMPHFACFDVDMYYRESIDKMKPDLAFRDKQGLRKLLLDYESPNSSDFRIIEKDFEHYLKIPIVLK